MSLVVIVLRILLSALLGGLVGLEREIHGGDAGLRTHILVCVGSTLFMITSIAVAFNYSEFGGADPSRIAAGVVTGIGFLGAGAIIRYGTSIRGLTTAASIWAISAIGLAVGAGVYVAAVVSAVVVLAVLILSRLEERMELKRSGKKLIIKLSIKGETDREDIKNIIEAYGGKVKHVMAKEKEEDGMETLVFRLILSRIYHKDIVGEINSLPGIEEVHWK